MAWLLSDQLEQNQAQIALLEDPVGAPGATLTAEAAETVAGVAEWVASELGAVLLVIVKSMHV
jgi:hypothetical protein